MTSVSDGIAHLPSYIYNLFKIKLDEMFSVIENIYTWTSGLTSNLTEAIATKLYALFVPSDDVFINFKDRLSKKFSFIVDIVDTAKMIVEFSASNTFDIPPTVTIPLSNVKTGMFSGMKDIECSMAWFEPYKNWSDIILSAFMWCKYVMHLFRTLPSIISGTNTLQNLEGV